MERNVIKREEKVAKANMQCFSATLAMRNITRLEKKDFQNHWHIDLEFYTP